MFVSLSRLFSRTRLQLRDALIGRSVLIGIAAGTVVFIIKGPLSMTIRTWIEGAPPFLFGYNNDLLLGQRQVIAVLVEEFQTIGMGFLMALTLVLMRMLLRRAWLAVASTIIIWTVISGLGSWESVLIGCLSLAVIITILLRWGIVAMLVTVVIERLAWDARTSDWSSWHGEPAAMVLVAVAGITLYGLWAATGGARTVAASNLEVSVRDKL